MKKLLLKIILLLIPFIFSSTLIAKDIANCESLDGYAYYLNYGLVPSNESGMADDYISKGKTSLKLLNKEKNEFDILYYDALGSITSSKQDGASILPLLVSPSSISLIVYWPSQTIEVYSFWREDNGKTKYSLQQSKMGDVPIRKVNLMVGDCSYLSFASLL